MKELECYCFVENGNDERCMICGKMKEEHKKDLEEEEF
jgi:hypothetical protein